VGNTPLRFGTRTIQRGACGYGMHEALVTEQPLGPSLSSGKPRPPSPLLAPVPKSCMI
jgi:hypothetical protein